MELTEQQYVAALRRWFGLSESVRVDASYEALAERILTALKAWPARPSNDMSITWTFPDRVIVHAWNNGEGYRAWEIPWQVDAEGNYTFAAPVEVNRVLIYEPVNESANQGRKGGQRLQETIEQTLTVTESKGDGSARKVKAIGITADVVNANGRRYPRKVLAEAVARLNGHLHESNGQGNLIATGEAEHPSDKGQRVNILETVVKWQAASLDAPGRVLLEGVILPTAKGRDVQVLVEAGVPIGVSMRGYGSSRTVQESGESVQEVTELTIKGFDLVAQPSDPNGAITEAAQVEANKLQENKTVNEEEKKALEEMQRKLQAELEESKKALADQAKQLEEAQKAQAELQERKAREAVDAAITEATKDLKWGDALNKSFVESVKAAKPQTPEAVKALVEARRAEYDGIAAAVKLAGMGATSGVQVKGPVFESETGRPEFTRPAWELNESLVKGGDGRRLNDNHLDETKAGVFAKRVLERFDALNKHHLTREARSFEEAETTSDLNLPYSVARTIIEQAYPQLVAANIFDFGVTDVAPARIQYETYTGDVGSYATITDESKVASTSAFVSLAHKRVRPGSVVITNSGASVTYVEGTDYVVDYEEGSFLAIATITNGQTVLVDYTYDAFREGEMAPIERAENALTSALLNIAADRLATEISTEAIVFSRSQLGYDAVNRTLANLVKMVNRKIDQGIMYKALAAALRQANNSGGTWTSASDAVNLLVEKIGVAKTKVYNRYYMPTAIIMSQTNADRLSNWDGFKVQGFSNAQINSAGFAGSVKGLPIYATTEFPDTYILIANRELVMHRVMQPMTIKGPFPSFNNGKLVAAEQYYVEEFNGSFVPVNEKASFVKVA
jgi:hypothetical protein